MGDAPLSSNLSNEYSAQESFTHPYPVETQANYPQGSNDNSNPVYQPQYQHQLDSSQNAFSAQFDMTHMQNGGRGGPQGVFNMHAMGTALPQPGYRPGYNPNHNNSGQNRYNTGGTHASIVPSMGSYASPTNVNPVVGQQYYMAQPSQMPHYYSTQMPVSQQHGDISPRHTMGFYPHQVILNQPHPQMAGGYYYPQPSQFHNQGLAVQGHVLNQYIPPGSSGTTSGIPQDQSISTYPTSDGAGEPRSSSSIVRGPPRKPRQSGHAIWVGNLPPQTDLMNLVHHVCNEAAGLESLFLISKSNCAFANFKDEQSCVEAQQKLHDSKFQSVRLVSRLRKSTVEGTSGQTAPTGPSATSSPSAPSLPADVTTSPQPTPAPPAQMPVSAQESDNEQKKTSVVDTGKKDRFFVLKSLTVEDLDLSVRNGVWATQSHNEESLNTAFKSSENVYLVFSANKSGEYFGYARMVSPINDDPAAAIEFAPTAQSANDVDLPKAIPTEATENCPRGKIIDDSARGTIFWEIEREDEDVATEMDSEEEEASSTKEDQDGEAGSKTWGKPFHLEWLSTTKLPFYRTRGLRNPWNSNREVKIARDGTELEPGVGRRLISLFNRVQSPAPMSMGVRQGGQALAGYPPPLMRPPYAPSHQ
ncbi:YT521-B-like domain-containing protein [Xylariales sp. PMI_506]|nr:YT521-B-like domain-containing protein [Xylariales sp. PMI_506]